MTLPLGNGKTIVTRDAAFEALAKEQIKEQAHECTASVKAALGERSDEFIRRSNETSKSFSAKVLPNPVANIAQESIDAAEPISQKAARVAINTGINLTTNQLVDKAVNWVQKK